MTADWSPFSSQFNWFIFMHPNMSCQLIGPCCLSVLSDWSIFLQISYSHPYMHCQLIGQLCLSKWLVHFSANLTQSPMHAIYNVSSDWSALSLEAVWLVHFSADQNMQYMIWLVSFALFSVLTVLSALLLHLWGICLVRSEIYVPFVCLSGLPWVSLSLVGIQTDWSPDPPATVSTENW